MAKTNTQKITLSMETTTKTPAETAGEIQSILSNYGLKRFMCDYHDGEITGCVFSIEINEREFPMKMPIRWEPLWVMAQRGETRYIKTMDQAKAVAWRQLLRWIEAQLSLIRCGMVDMVQVFLPFIVTKNGDSLYESFEKNATRYLGYDGKNETS